MKTLRIFASVIFLLAVDSRYVCELSEEHSRTGCKFKNLIFGDECDGCDEEFEYKSAGARDIVTQQTIEWTDIINSTFVKPKPIFRYFSNAQRVNILGCRGLNNIDIPMFNERTLLISFFWTELGSVGQNLLKGLSELIVLMMTRSSVKSIHKNAFRDLRKLRSIDLGNNEIKSLDDEVFAFNPKLENIILEGNNIVSINARLFSRNFKLSNLELHSNKVWMIEDGFTNNLKQLTTVNLKSNRCADVSIGILDQLDLRSLLGVCFQNFHNWNEKKSSGKSSESASSKSGSSESSESKEGHSKLNSSRT